MSGDDEGPTRNGGEEGAGELPLPSREGVVGRGLRALCRLDDIPDCGSKGFPPPPGGFTGLFAVRRGNAVHVYVNSCPHIGTPLDWLPDRFFDRSGEHLLCGTHGALFRPEDGECVRGPCFGRRLAPVPMRVIAGEIVAECPPP